MNKDFDNLPEETGRDNSVDASGDNDRFSLPHPELDKRAWLSYIAFALALLGWLGIFFFPKPKEVEEANLMEQIYILMGVAALSGLLAWLGRKRAPMLTIVVIVIDLFLILTLLPGLMAIS